MAFVIPVCCVMKGEIYCSGLISVAYESAITPASNRTIAISVIRFRTAFRPVVSTSTTTNEALRSSMDAPSSENKAKLVGLGGEKGDALGYFDLGDDVLRGVEDHRIVVNVSMYLRGRQFG